jgi:nucleoid DNA-binding protein
MEKEKSNERLYKETALKTGLSPHQIEEFFKVTCEFTEQIIKTGGCETVMWPNFGKFKLKVKQFQFLETLRMNNLKARQDEAI